MEVDDENVSVSTGRGHATLSDMKRRKNGSENDLHQGAKASKEKFDGTVRQASETAGGGVKTSDPKVKHYDADGTPI